MDAPSNQLVDHYFRHESARLVAALTRRLGIRHMPLAEDAVQTALARAVTSWSRTGVPSEPSGWLMRVASNHAIDVLRREAKQSSTLPECFEQLADGSADLAAWEERDLQDSLLRMIFVCCDPSVPAESQTALALKALCGFSYKEIARALISTTESIAKRVSRSKHLLRQRGTDLGEINADQMESRLPDVRRVVYLLFNEGYSSTQPDRLIRVELCEEAIRLALLLAEHPLTQGAVSSAFLALLLFHASRLDARLDSSGAILLFSEQNVSQWDLRLLKEAFRWFERATEQPVVSRYHAEAMIAAEHCQGKLGGKTEWSRIVAAYDLLCRIAPSSIHDMNRAIAVAHHQDAEAGLQLLESIQVQELADHYYLWHAARGEMLAMSAQPAMAEASYRTAWELAPTQAEKELMCRKIDGLAECDS
ncbi:MAG: sigma-70 family RNA polymerase sigma factor [Planctomycetota bacterium]